MSSYKMSLTPELGLYYRLYPSWRSTDYQISHGYHQLMVGWFHRLLQGNLSLQLCGFRQHKHCLSTSKSMNQRFIVGLVTWKLFKGLQHYSNYHTPFKSQKSITKISMRNPLLFFNMNFFIYLIIKLALPVLVFLPHREELIQSLTNFPGGY